MAGIDRNIIVQQRSIRTKQRILAAAAEIVSNAGVSELTLETVAEQAGISKGGLLYHFEDKDALVLAMVTAPLERFEAEVERRLNADPDQSSGHWLRAFVGATIDYELPDRDLNAGMLAAAATNPNLLGPVQEAFNRWQQRAISDGIEPTRATIIRLVADGLWLADMFDLAPPSEQRREDLRARLVAMTRDQDASQH